jgi:hypothetical protein
MFDEFSYVLIWTTYDFNMFIIHLYNVLICLQYHFGYFEMMLLFYRVATDFGHFYNLDENQMRNYFWGQRMKETIVANLL